MDLKLKDKIVKILIEKPNLSISSLSKEVDTDYSYVHRLVSQMETEGILIVRKRNKGKKEITSLEVSEKYKKEWARKLKIFIKSQLKDAEIKAAFLVLYVYLAITTFFVKTEKPLLLKEATDVFMETATKMPLEPVNWGLRIFIISSFFLICWIIQKTILNFKTKEI